MYTFIDIDECSSSPCSNGGTCNDQVNEYSCTCASGYSGLGCAQGAYFFKKINYFYFYTVVDSITPDKVLN